MADVTNTVGEQLRKSMDRIEQYLDRHLDRHLDRQLDRPLDRRIKDNSKYRIAYHQAVDLETLIGYYNNTIYLYAHHTNQLQLIDSTHILIKNIDLSANYDKSKSLIPISMTVNGENICVRNQNAIEIISYTDDMFAVIPYTNSYQPTHNIELKHKIYTITATGYVLTISTDQPIYKFTSVTKDEVPLYCKKVQIIDDTIYYLNNNYEFVIYSLKTHELLYTLPIVYDYCVVGSNIYITTNYTMQRLELV